MQTKAAYAEFLQQPILAHSFSFLYDYSLNWIGFVWFF